jgi:hypothetical protein
MRTWLRGEKLCEPGIFLRPLPRRFQYRVGSHHQNAPQIAVARLEIARASAGRAVPRQISTGGKHRPIDAKTGSNKKVSPM